MNDSISLSSSTFSDNNNSSSNNSKSNSLNRNEIHLNESHISKKLSLIDSMDTDANNNLLRLKRNVEASKKEFTNHEHDHVVSQYLSGPRKSSLPIAGNRRRAKSQILFNGDDLNTINEQNKLLIEDVYYLKKQLKDKDTTIRDLNDIRDRLESEIHELSASLFEQAYKMVNTAQAEQAQAEKLLKEANGKIDVLQAEVTALKEVVSTSKAIKSNIVKKNSSQLPKSSNNNNHVRQSSLNQQTLNQMSKMNLAARDNGTHNPTLLAATPPVMPSITSSNTSLNSIVLQVTDGLVVSRSEMSFASSVSSGQQYVKGHKRGLSHNDIQMQPQPKSFMDKLFSNSSTSQKEVEVQKQQIINSLEGGSSKNNNGLKSIDNVVCVVEPEPDYDIEINELYFKEISAWRDQLPIDLLEESAFTRRVYREDIRPCLNFNNEQTEVCEQLLTSIRSNTLFIEDLNTCSLTQESLVKVCGLSHAKSMCQYKIRLDENEAWIYISKHSRNRVISVCDFFTYLRYIKDGLVKCDIIEIYWNIIDLRKKICLSRLGL